MWVQQLNIACTCCSVLRQVNNLKASSSGGLTPRLSKGMSPLAKTMSVSTPRSRPRTPVSTAMISLVAMNFCIFVQTAHVISMPCWHIVYVCSHMCTAGQLFLHSYVMACCAATTSVHEPVPATDALSCLLVPTVPSSVKLASDDKHCCHSV